MQAAAGTLKPTMKKLAQFLCLSIVFVSVAYADTVVYTTTLSGAAEAPPNASTGTGTAIVTLDTAAHTLMVNATFSGLIGTTTASHIHCCTAAPLTGTAGVATTVPTFAGFPLGVTSGTYRQTLDLTSPSSYNPAFLTAQGGTVAGAEAALVAGLAGGRAYLNVHSTTNPGGEIRGFLSERIQTGFAVITPKSPATGQNMVVSGTFANQNSCGATQAGIEGVKLSRTGIIPIAANTTLGRDLGVAIVNVNNTDATVTFTLRGADGEEISSVEVTIPALSHKALFASQLFADDPAATNALLDFLGTLTYESNLPVAVVGLRFQGSNFSTVPATITSEATFDVPVIASGVGGPGAVVLPQFAAGRGWNTQIAITNNGMSQPQQFRVDLFDQNGSPLIIDLNGETGSSFSNLVAPVSGAVFLSTGGGPF